MEGSAFCNTCEQNPCTCAKARAATFGWLMVHCATAHCNTSIRVRAGQQRDGQVCKWCERGQAAGPLDEGGVTR